MGNSVHKEFDVYKMLLFMDDQISHYINFTNRFIDNFYKNNNNQRNDERKLTGLIKLPLIFITSCVTTNIKIYFESIFAGFAQSTGINVRIVRFL